MALAREQNCSSLRQERGQAEDIAGGGDGTCTLNNLCSC
jgi:hypothetical protein